MTECDYCGNTERLIHTCNYCNNKYCKHHYLPENHNCIGLTHSTTHGPNFRTLLPETTTELTEPTDQAPDKNTTDEIKDTAYTAPELETEIDQETTESQNQEPDQPPDPGLEPSSTEPESEPKYCEGCGEEITGIDSEYCIECRRKGIPVGATTGDSSPQVELKTAPQEQTEPAPYSYGYKLLTVLVILLTIGLLLFFSMIRTSILA